MVSLREPIPSSASRVSALDLLRHADQGDLLLLRRPIFLLLLFSLQTGTLDGVLLEHLDGLRHRADLVAAPGADDLHRRIALRQAAHRCGHGADRRGNAANDCPADAGAEQGGQHQHRQDPAMRRCAKLRTGIGSLRALTHVQVDVGLQGFAELRHHLRCITQEQRDRLIALALRHQSGAGVAERQVALPRRIECVRQALFFTW